MERWKNSVAKKVPEIEWIHGNALNINSKKGEALVGFDRIYVGASVEKEDVPKLTRLLRPGGILVGPGMFSVWLSYLYLSAIRLTHSSLLPYPPQPQLKTNLSKLSE